MRTFRPLVLCAIVLLSSLPAEYSTADSVEICCDSGPVELFFLGAAGSGTMSPFDVELESESQEVVITDAIAQGREIATWSINPAWTGSYPSSTWEFGIKYYVANAGGAQINATVSVEVGGETYTGSTDQSNSFLSGEGTLTIDVDVDSGTIPTSTEIRVTLNAQTVVFSVPGSDAGLTFKWGGDDDKSSINADLPIVDILIDEPVTEGMDVYISAIIASPFGQMTAAHSNSLEIIVNGATLTGDPIGTSSGDYVRLTWTWRASDEGEQVISIQANIRIQALTPALTGGGQFTITTYDDGNDGGGVFYPTEEPVRTDGTGSPLIANMEIKLDKEKDFLTLEREIELIIDEDIAYWMRWGLDNMGGGDPALSTPLTIFKSGMITDEDRRNRIIDDIEISEFENQMFNLAVTYMNEGMALELEELIGSNAQNLERFSVSLDLKGESRVTPHPLTMTISTLELIKADKSANILRNFIIVQPSPIWSSIDLNINIETSYGTSLTGATIKGDDSLKNSLQQTRTPWGESMQINADELKPSSTFVLTAMPTSNLLNAPLSLSAITVVSLLGGLYASMLITSSKRRSALWIEMILLPVVLLSLYLAYEPFTVGVITGITISIWIITAVASPTRKGVKLASKTVADYPTIDCPACSITNAITSEIRPFRLPCQGCSRILKIVE
jgi:hypothetical protein